MVEKRKSYNFFAFLSRMKYINRWGLMRNTFPENIQEHSLQVAIIAHALALIRNKVFGGNVNADRIAVVAMFHDCNETITGDMPTPVKYFNPQIMKAYKEVESISRYKLLDMLPEYLAGEYKTLLMPETNSEDIPGRKIIKAADRIAAYIKCIEEEKAGNKEFKKAKESIYQSIESIDASEMPEVNFFMKTFIPGFSLTLDELD